MTRTGPRELRRDGGDSALPEFVNVEPAPGFALYWDHEQRTTSCERVPRDTALQWMRAKWAAYCWTP